MLWKHQYGNAPSAPRSLPYGALQALIYDAHRRMATYNAFHCGLSTTASKNIMNMSVDGISTRSGEINGFLYFFINRHDDEILPTVADATEDAERSLLYVRKDKCVLRCRMYCGDTRCAKNLGGLQSLYGGWGDATGAASARRKDAEHDAALRLHEMFPDITGPPQVKKMKQTLYVNFLSMGGAIIPSTTVAELGRSNALENEWRARHTGRPRGRRSRRLNVDAVPPLPEVIVATAVELAFQSVDLDPATMRYAEFVDKPALREKCILGLPYFSVSCLAPSRRFGLGLRWISL